MRLIYYRPPCPEHPLVGNDQFLKGGIVKRGPLMSVMPSQGLHGRRLFCSPLSRFLGKSPLPPFAKGGLCFPPLEKGGQGGFGTEGGQSPQVPVPIFMMRSTAQ